MNVNRVFSIALAASFWGCSSSSSAAVDVSNVDGYRYGVIDGGKSKGSEKGSIELSNYVLIYGGDFTMGSPPDEIGREDNELQISMHVDDFYIKSTEVTQDEWERVMGYNPSKYKGCGEDCPVNTVNWYEGLEYMNRLSVIDGLRVCYVLEDCSGDLRGGDYECQKVEWEQSCNGYRYPTEAEWEYAARGGDVRATYNGNLTIEDKVNATELDAIAVYGGNSKALYEGAFYCGDWKDKKYPYSTCGPGLVKAKNPNGYMLYDMIGNVWEWTWDTYDKKLTNKDLEGRYSKRGSKSLFSFRGCSWSSHAQVCRAANRSADYPTLRIYYLGLRPARSI
jgi:formylglycine-generating enzyme required for sulfatase activity